MCSVEALMKTDITHKTKLKLNVYIFNSFYILGMHYTNVQSPLLHLELQTLCHCRPHFQTRSCTGCTIPAQMTVSIMHHSHVRTFCLCGGKTGPAQRE